MNDIDRRFVGFVSCGLWLILIVGIVMTWWQSPQAAENIVVDREVISGAAAGGTAGTLGTAVTRCRETAAYVVWSAGATAGVVVIESAHDATYTGTWASLATVNWSAATKVDIAQITGIHRALRARISTSVSNGTVTVRFVCN